METEIIVCTSCLHENDERRDFCEECGLPISTTASFTPIGSILSEGNGYRNAASNPSKPIIIIGIYLIFLPGLLAILAVTPSLIEDKAPLGVFAILGLFGAGSFLMLFKTTKNYVKNKSNQKRELTA